MFGHHYYGVHYFGPHYFGGVGILDIFLPDAATLDDGKRKRYGFFVREPATMRVNAINDNVIRIGADVSSANGNITCGDVGSFVELAALSDTEWDAVAEVPSGAWTVSP